MGRFKVRISAAEKPDVNYANYILETPEDDTRSAQEVCHDFATAVEGLAQNGVILGGTHTSGQILAGLGVDSPSEDTGKDPLKGDGAALREREEAKAKGRRKTKDK